jgi:hypothetical protein
MSKENCLLSQIKQAKEKLVREDLGTVYDGCPDGVYYTIPDGFCSVCTLGSGSVGVIVSGEKVIGLTSEESGKCFYG